MFDRNLECYLLLKNIVGIVIFYSFDKYFFLMHVYEFLLANGNLYLNY